MRNQNKSFLLVSRSDSINFGKVVGKGASVLFWLQACLWVVKDTSIIIIGGKVYEKKLNIIGITFYISDSNNS